jgi:hypothetical protein
MKEMPFGTGAARPKDDPTESLARKVALLLELLRHQTLDVERACQRYDADKRTLQRDLSQLRKLGESLGFSISKTENGLVKLMDFERRPRQFADDRGALAQLAAEIARAFGAPMGEQLGSLATLRPGGDPFIRFLSPILAADSRVAKIVAQLQDAMKSPAGRCFVRFRYRAPSRAGPHRHSLGSVLSGRVRSRPQGLAFFRTRFDGRRTCTRGYDSICANGARKLSQR